MQSHLGPAGGSPFRPGGFAWCYAATTNLRRVSMTGRYLKFVYVKVTTPVPNANTRGVPVI